MKLKAKLLQNGKLKEKKYVQTIIERNGKSSKESRQALWSRKSPSWVMIQSRWKYSDGGLTVKKREKQRIMDKGHGGSREKGQK